MQPGDLHPRGDGIVDRVPALERREQRGVRVDDPVGEGVVDRLLEDGAEAGHGDEVDVVAAEGVEHLVGVGDPVEVGTKSGAFDDLDRHAGGFGDAERAARSVGEDDRDREVVVEHRAQDRAAARRQHPEPPHAPKVAEWPRCGPARPRVLAFRVEP